MNPRRKSVLGLLFVAAVVAGSRASSAPSQGRALAVTVSAGAGFEPKTINARVGETLRLAITASDRDHCLSIPTLGVEKRLRRARATAVDIGIEKAGSYVFACCVEEAGRQETGQILAVE